MYIEDNGFVFLQPGERDEVIRYCIGELVQIRDEESETIRDIQRKNCASTRLLNRMMDDRTDIHRDQIGFVISALREQGHKWAAKEKGNKDRYRGFTQYEVKACRAYECMNQIHKELGRAGIDLKMFGIRPLHYDEYAEGLIAKKSRNNSAKCGGTRANRKTARNMEVKGSVPMRELSLRMRVQTLTRDNARLMAKLEHDILTAKVDENIEKYVRELEHKVEDLKLDLKEAEFDAAKFRKELTPKVEEIARLNMANRINERTIRDMDGELTLAHREADTLRALVRELESKIVVSDAPTFDRLAA